MMTFHSERLVFIVLFLAVFGLAVAHAEGVFQILDIPEGFEKFKPKAISDDGSVVVGEAYGDDSLNQAFFWRDGEGFEGLNSIHLSSVLSRPVGLSGDGTIMYGMASTGKIEGNDYYYSFRPFRWYFPGDSMQSVLTNYNDFPNADTMAGAFGWGLFDVSRDGSTVVGSYKFKADSCPDGIYPPEWTTHGFRLKNGVFEDLGVVPGGECTNGLYGQLYPTVAYGVSGDGIVIVGEAGKYNEYTSEGGNTYLSIANDAFFWDGSMNVLPEPSADADWNAATDVSDDGVSTVGYVALGQQSEEDYALVRWIGGAMQDMNYPGEGHNLPSSGVGISGNGQFIYVDSFIWSADNGWQTLNELVTLHGITAPPEMLDKICDISYDGNTLLGYSNGGYYTPWRIILDACPDLETGEGTAQWLSGTDGDFSNQANWFGNIVPGATKTVMLNEEGIYKITMDGYFTNQALINTKGDITLDLNDKIYNLSAGFGCGPALINGLDDIEPVSLIVRNGKLNLGDDLMCLGGTDSYFVLDEAAEVTVDGRVFIEAPEPMQFIIDGGASLTAYSAIVLGDEENYSGSMEIFDGNSQLNGSLVTVGSKGTGVLSVDSSSFAAIEILSIGGDINGQGLVNVLNGATVTVDILTMADEMGSFGDLAISGEFTDFINATARIGVNDSAKVSITDGASVGGTDTTSWELGVNEGSSGDLLLSGIGTEARLEELYVGLHGLGDLQVLDGARLANGPNPMDQVVVGGGPTGAASVFVSGNNAQLITEFMIAGLDGSAIVSCTDDAYIQANGLYIGPFGNVSSNVLVIGTIGRKDASRAETGIAVKSLTLSEGATLDVNTVTLGNGGTLAGSGGADIDIVNNGTISPGDSAGHLAVFTVSGDYSQTADGILEIELGESNSDMLEVDGAVNLDGTLHIILDQGYTPEFGDEFIVGSGAAINGTFASIEKPAGVEIAVDYPGGNTVRVIIQSTTDVTIEEAESGLPGKFALSQNYPNPFNPSTQIDFAIIERNPVNLTIYDILGREVIRLVDKTMPAGSYKVTWDGRNNAGERISSGIYLYRLKAGDDEAVAKMILIK